VWTGPSQCRDQHQAWRAAEVNALHGWAYGRPVVANRRSPGSAPAGLAAARHTVSAAFEGRRGRAGVGPSRAMLARCAGRARPRERTRRTGYFDPDPYPDIGRAPEWVRGSERRVTGICGHLGDARRNRLCLALDNRPPARPRRRPDPRAHKRGVASSPPGSGRRRATR